MCGVLAFGALTVGSGRSNDSAGLLDLRGLARKVKRFGFMEKTSETTSRLTEKENVTPCGTQGAKIDGRDHSGGISVRLPNGNIVARAHNGDEYYFFMVIYS